ncbi:MAG: hypothetical protein E8D40_07870 [Nitrospira sp.]|nr:MAG: hypothetical protein E8D40_07870 [Nitrospira sp.]
MLYYAIAGGLLGLIGFCVLPPRIKVLIAFVVMTSCFDVTPRIIAGIDVWDIGALLLLIAWGQLALFHRKTPGSRVSYVVVLQLLVGWMGLCLLWSVLIYDYPALNSVKASRQMILGVLSFFVFRKLFVLDDGAYEFLMKALYLATFGLLPVCLTQFALHQPILFGLYRAYDDVTRSLPVFLPVVLLFVWMILSKVLTATRISVHELVYVGMAIAITVLTFTRGIYLVVLFVFGVMLVTLAIKKSPESIRLNFVVAPMMLILFLVGGAGLYFGGYAEKVIERFTSAVELVVGEKAATKTKNEDTYTGRLGIAKERFRLVLAHNPVVGYGFIHEDDVPRSLRTKLKYGSVIYTPEYVERYKAGYPYVLAFHSADIGWADIMINTGCVGLALWGLLFAALIKNFYATARRTSTAYYHARLAHFLQILVGLLLMVESNTFVSLVQIPALMLAGYWYCAKGQGALHSAHTATAPMDVIPASG